MVQGVAVRREGTVLLRPHGISLPAQSQIKSYGWVKWNGVLTRYQVHTGKAILSWKGSGDQGR